MEAGVNDIFYPNRSNWQLSQYHCGDCNCLISNRRERPDCYCDCHKKTPEWTYEETKLAEKAEKLRDEGKLKAT